MYLGKKTPLKLQIFLIFLLDNLHNGYVECANVFGTTAVLKVSKTHHTCIDACSKHFPLFDFSVLITVSRLEYR
jgi:hypothetical protein